MEKEVFESMNDLDDGELIVFGFSGGGASEALRMRFVELTEMLARRVGSEVALFEASSYEELAGALTSGAVDVAWLPPIPFVALSEKRAAVPLVSLRRGGHARFSAAIVVRGDSSIVRISDLVGKRAAWVDRLSASGFTVPRIALFESGVDPRTAFVRERFFHSHEAVTRAVLGGIADFGATYAGTDESGEVTRGPWTIGTSAKEVRVLKLVGDIPGDVVAASARLDERARAKLRDAMIAISQNKKARLLARGAFGADELVTFEADGYADLAIAIREATARGVLEVASQADASGAFTIG